MRLLLRLVINALVLMLIAEFLPGVSVSGFYSAIIAAIILGLINAFIRPVLLFFTLPITILTLGLFTLVINGLLFWFAGTVVEGFTVLGFWPAFWGAFIISIASSLTSWFFKQP